MNTITARLILVLTGCLAAIFAAGLLLDYRLSRDEILERLRLQSIDTVESAITDMDNWLDGVEGATLFLAELVENQDFDREHLARLLQDIVEQNGDIFGAAIALNPERAPDPGGFAPYYFRRDGAISYADLASEAYHYRDRDWYRRPAATGRPVWVEPYFDEGGGGVLMTTFSVPVFKPGDGARGDLYAVVTADVSLAELRAYLRRLRLGESGNAILLSHAGIVLGSRQPGSVMRHYSEVIAGEADRATWREMVDAALQGQAVSRRVPCAALPGDCAVRLDTLDSTGWPVGVIYSEREVLAPLRAFRQKTLLLGSATLMLMAAAVALVTHRLTRPLSALARASDEIARGNLDASLPAARGGDEIAQLVRSFGAMTRDLRRHIAELEAAAASRSRIEGELNAAREIQMSLLPGGGQASESFGPWHLWARVEPARRVGGDLYGYFRLDRQAWIAVGDVSDKGVPAALFMARAVSLLPQLVGPGADPAAVMARLNEALEEGNDNCMFVTLFLGTIDLAAGTLRFASAGHTAPSLLRDGRVATLAQETGPALGLARGQTFPLNTLSLAPGDRLAIFTDGIEEAFNDRREMFGVERFNQRLAATGGEALPQAGAALFAAVAAFAGAVPQSDDITLMLLEYGGGDRSGQAASRLFSRGERLVTRALEWLGEALEAAHVPPAVIPELQLVLEEIVTNVDKYAGLGEEDGIEVSVRRLPDRVVLEVADPGRPLDPLESGRRAPLGRESDSADVGGLGVHLITRLTDRQSYRRLAGRNVLQVEKALGAVSGAFPAERED